MPETSERGRIATLRALHDEMRAYGGRPAVIALNKAGAVRWTYAGLITVVEQVASGLRQAGLAKGERVLLLAPPSAQWIASALGVIQAGGVVVPLDTQFDRDVLHHIVEDCQPRFAFTVGALFPRLAPAERLGDRVFFLDAGSDDPRSWERLKPDAHSEPLAIEEEDPACLFYTSGTTGLPKGVPLTHANLAFQVNALRGANVVGPADRVLLPLPLHHVYPFVMGLFGPFAFGIPVILPEGLTGPQILRALNEEAATVIVGVPRLYEALLSGVRAQFAARGAGWVRVYDALLALAVMLRRHLGLAVGNVIFRPIRRRFGAQLRVVASGGAALATALGYRLEALGWQLATGYGLTETSPLLTLDPPGQARIGSVGRPVPGVELRIAPRRPYEEERADGVGGEVLARGPNVFRGYLHLKEETERAFTDDGWFRTGDLGYFDESGYLYITGRASTLIVAEGGENIQPDAVEEAYARSAVIREIGILQHEGRLRALVVPNLAEVRKREADAEQAVREAVAEQSRRLPSYQRISQVVLTREPLPRTRLGKIRRHLLPQRYDQARRATEAPGAQPKGPLPVEQMSDQDAALLDHPEAAAVWRWLAERYPGARLTPDTSPQLDLGVDSLGWVELTLDIGQRSGVELGDAAIARIDTVRDLLHEVVQATEREPGFARPVEEPERVLSERQRRWLRPAGPLRASGRWLLYWENRLLVRTLFPVRVTGAPPIEEPFVLAPNHVSYLDPFVLAAVLDYSRLKHTYWAGWAGAAFTNPLTRLGSRLAQVVPIDPHQAALSSLAVAAAVLRRGNNLVWFPEGARSADGRLQPFRPGIGILLSRYSVPVIPVVLSGTYEAMPRGRRVPKRTKLTVAFGEPVSSAALQREGEGASAQQRITDALYRRTHTLQTRLEEGTQ